MTDSWIVAVVFVGVYAGMALGRWPGLAVDRTGAALIGALVLLLAGVVDEGRAVAFIDFHTLAVLFTLMVVSAQFAAAGFFDWVGARIAHAGLGERGLLALVVATSGGLSALLTNDVVVWALTPILVSGLIRRGVAPGIYVIALATAANAGSAATVIGNPQNLLIGQAGGLDFWEFFVVCGVPAGLALGVVYGVCAWRLGPVVPRAAEPPAPVSIARLPLVKALAAAAGMVAVFTLAEDKALWSLAIAGALLLSRRLTTRRMLGLVDWHLLLLFVGLFVVTGGVGDALAPYLAEGAGVSGLEVLAGLSLAAGNTIGNVPYVMLLLSVLPGWSADGLYALAVFSTLAGNLLIVGSVANIIAVERAKALGVTIGFGDYARIGVPVTVLSMALAYGWLSLV